MGIFDRSSKPKVKKLKHKRDIHGLSEALSHKDRDVRTSAAEALGEIGEKAAIDALIKLLSAEDSHLRESAITSLGKTKATTAIQPLATALTDKDSRVRVKAGLSLIQMGELDRVIKTLDDRNSKARQSAAEALGESNDRSAIGALIKALEDSSKEVRDEVARALRHFESADARDALGRYEVRQREARIARLHYVVGRHLVKDGYYKQPIGTETIGYFDPLKVVFRLFDTHGRRITAGGGGATSLVWPPPCDSEVEQTYFAMMASSLAHSLEAYPSTMSMIYMMSNPLGEMGRLLPNLERVGEGEVNQLIFESTVHPFFQRYSAGQKILVIDELSTEVRLNAIFNFLCSEVVPHLRAKDVGTDKLKRRASEMIRQTKGRAMT